MSMSTYVQGTEIAPVNETGDLPIMFHAEIPGTNGCTLIIQADDTDAIAVAILGPRGGELASTVLTDATAPKAATAIMHAYQGRWSNTPERENIDELPESLRAAAALRSCGDPDCSWPEHDIPARAALLARLSPGYTPRQAGDILRTARLNAGCPVAFDLTAGGTGTVRWDDYTYITYDTTEQEN